MALCGGWLGMVVKKSVIDLVVIIGLVVLGFFLTFPEVVFIFVVFLTFVMVFLPSLLKLLGTDVVFGGNGTT